MRALPLVRRAAVGNTAVQRWRSTARRTLDLSWLTSTFHSSIRAALSTAVTLLLVAATKLLLVLRNIGVVSMQLIAVAETVGLVLSLPPNKPRAQKVRQRVDHVSN